MIPLFKSPKFPQNTGEELQKILDSGWTGEGPKVKEFEKALSEQLFEGYKYLCTTSSCTAALSLALRLIGVGPGDYVLCTTNTFIAGTTVVLNTGADIIWVEPDRDSFHISPATLEMALLSLKPEIKEKVKAIIVLHWGGVPADLDGIRQVLIKYNLPRLPVVEDCAHALGARYKGTPIGLSGNYCCFSFQSTKHLSTGNGGLLICPNRDEWTRAKKLRYYGVDREEKRTEDFRRENDVVELGDLWHMTDVEAVLGLASLTQLQENLEARRVLADVYNSRLKGQRYVFIQEVPDNCLPSYWQYSLRIADYPTKNHFCSTKKNHKKKVMKALEDAGVQSSIVHSRNDVFSITAGRDITKINWTALEKLESELLSIPCGPWVTISDAINISSIILDQLPKETAK